MRGAYARGKSFWRCYVVAERASGHSWLHWPVRSKASTAATAVALGWSQRRPWPFDRFVHSHSLPCDSLGAPPICLPTRLANLRVADHFPPLPNKTQSRGCRAPTLPMWGARSARTPTIPDRPSGPGLACILAREAALCLRPTPAPIQCYMETRPFLSEGFRWKRNFSIALKPSSSVSSN